MWRDVRSDGATPCPAGLRDDPGEVIAAARAAGLIYAQHIIALHAAITGQITPAPRAPPARTRPPAPRRTGNTRVAVTAQPGLPAVCCACAVFIPGGAFRWGR